MHGGGGLELRWGHGLIGLALLACGGAPPTDAGRAERQRSVMAAEGAPSAAPAPSAPAIRDALDRTRIEPQVLVPLALEPRPARGAAVRLARLELGPGGSFRPASTPCEDVLVLVREGELRAVGSGVAPPQAPATLYAGDAVRFGPEGDGALSNTSDQPARTIVAFARAEDPAACEAPREVDPLVGPLRVASVRTAPELAALGGALRVRVLLDADGAGGHGGLSVLEGDPGLVVPAHRHADADEILYVERGAGVLRIGERALRVRPGSAVYIEQGTLHSYEGAGDEPLHAIQVYTPAGPEQRYRGGT